MKTIKIFIISILLTSVNTVFSQDTYEKYSIEKEYGGLTFIIHDNVMENKESKNYRYLVGGKKCDNFRIPEQTTPLLDIIKKVISKEKINTLAVNDKEDIRFHFYFDTKTGKIVHIRFVLRNIEFSDDKKDLTRISLKEIYELYCLLNDYRFKVEPCDNPEYKYDMVIFGFKFAKLAE